VGNRARIRHLELAPLSDELVDQVLQELLPATGGKSLTGDPSGLIGVEES